MVKKTYIHPDMKVVAIATRKMMCESIGVYGNEVNGSAALGRESDFDDDEY